MSKQLQIKCLRSVKVVLGHSAMRGSLEIYEGEGAKSEVRKYLGSRIYISKPCVSVAQIEINPNESQALAPELEILWGNPDLAS